MSNFHDIQLAKKRLNDLIKKREDLIIQYYNKYIEEQDSTNGSISSKEFREFFAIKNLQQLPNFRSFQNSSDTDLLNWALRKHNKKPAVSSTVVKFNNENINTKNSSESLIVEKPENTTKTDNNVLIQPNNEIEVDEIINSPEVRSKRKLQEIEEPKLKENDDKVEDSNKILDDPIKRLYKRLKINELPLNKRSNKFASEPTKVKLKDEYLEYLKKINNTNKLDQQRIKKSVNSFYNQDKQNTKKTVYLTMNPAVPTSIPNSKPLYELVYLQNTLPLKKLICSSEKVLTTDIWERTLHENKQAIVSNRIEDLKRSGKWSLRQEKVFKDPIKEIFNKPIFTSNYKETNRQLLLKEAYWLAIDFKEYSKWKMAMKVMISQAVMEYFTLGKEVCCVKIKNQDKNQVAIDVIEKEHKYSDVDMLRQGVGDPLVQRAIDEELTEILNYKPAFKFDLIQDECKMNKVEKAIINSLPTNVTGYKQLSTAEIKKKKQYLEELLEEELCYIPANRIMYPKETENYVKIAQRDFLDFEMSAEAITKKRGLFGGNTMRKTLLKPPTPPNLECIKHRMPVFWLPKDDELLVSLINEYRYNWDIIASHMNNKTTFGFQSSVMKRTPWTCFERYLQLNEKFDLSELKGYRASLALAWLNHQNQIMDAEEGGKTSMKPIGLTEDSKQRGHRSLLWASLFDGMKKVIMQRENKKIQASQNRQKANNLAAQAKANAEAQLRAQEATNTLNKDAATPEISQPKRLVTPMELSEIKYKRDAEIKKQQELKKLQNKQKLIERQQQQKQQIQHQQKQHELQQQKPSKQKITPRDLIETYAVKLMNARPNISKDDALKAAETYYRTLLAQQQKRITSAQLKKQQANENQPRQPSNEQQQ
ncbi:hypothetical protein QEN19_002383 [Hanseniaspora menglaensis]